MSEEKRYVKGVVYETSLWKEEDTGRYFTKCLKCKNIEYIDLNLDIIWEDSVLLNSINI